MWTNPQSYSDQITSHELKTSLMKKDIFGAAHFSCECILIWKCRNITDLTLESVNTYSKHKAGAIAVSRYVYIPQFD